MKRKEEERLRQEEETEADEDDELEDGKVVGGVGFGRITKEEEGRGVG